MTKIIVQDTTHLGRHDVMSENKKLANAFKSQLFFISLQRKYI